MTAQLLDARPSLDPRSTQEGESSPDLARTLMTYRQQHRLTLKQAAASIGTTDSGWSKWEQGSVPSPANLDKIAALLGLTGVEVRVLSGPDRVRRPGSLGDAGATGLAACRHERGLTTTELARRLHLSASIVSRWESGERVPNEDHRQALAAALQVEPAAVLAMFHGRVAPSEQAAVPGLARTRLERGLSQQALSRVLEVDVTSVRRWERTGTAPQRLADRICQVLGPGAAEPGPPVVQPRPRTSSRLHVLRKRRGLPVVIIAARVGVTPSTVCSWERGARKPDWARARKLAAVLREPPAAVFDALSLEPPRHLGRDTWTRQELPEILQEVRRWHGLTQRDLARRLGLAKSTVTAWETGRHQPSTRAMAALVRLLNHHFA